MQVVYNFFIVNNKYVYIYFIFINNEYVIVIVVLYCETFSVQLRWLS